jgi:hypothetical protein
MKTLTKWLRKYIFWMNDIRHINTNIWDRWQFFCHPSWRIFASYSIPHPSDSGSEIAKDLPVIKCHTVNPAKRIRVWKLYPANRAQGQRTCVYWKSIYGV